MRIAAPHPCRSRPLRRGPRAGYTVLELMVVLAILVTLAAILAPTFGSINKDSRVKAGADVLRARIAEARGAAVSDNRAYRLAVSQDGLRVRIAPDDASFATAVVVEDDDTDEPIHVNEDAFPQTVTATPVFDDDQSAVTDDAGWVRVATFLPDGTCRDDSAVVSVQEPGVAPLWVRIRGLTGSATVGPAPKEGAR